MGWRRSTIGMSVEVSQKTKPPGSSRSTPACPRHPPGHLRTPVLRVTLKVRPTSQQALAKTPTSDTLGRGLDTPSSTIMHLQASSMSVYCPGSGSGLRGCPHQPTAAALSSKTAGRRVLVLTRYRPKDDNTNSSSNSSDEDAFRIHRAPSPAQLERAYQKTAQDMQLRADEFFTPHKGGSGQQPKVFVFVRHGHSTWNEQSRIQVSRVVATAAAFQGWPQPKGVSGTWWRPQLSITVVARSSCALTP